ncbi:hypothetical protein L218DRAFT_472717 [Marasmius fiardii PR-910]|nr:hypothetical protein L218DRAFT_472717 [Marasmius fiardii PR-910]
MDIKELVFLTGSKFVNAKERNEDQYQYQFSKPRSISEKLELSLKASKTSLDILSIRSYQLLKARTPVTTPKRISWNVRGFASYGQSDAILPLDVWAWSAALTEWRLHLRVKYAHGSESAGTRYCGYLESRRLSRTDESYEARPILSPLYCSGGVMCTWVFRWSPTPSLQKGKGQGARSVEREDPIGIKWN